MNCSLMRQLFTSVVRLHLEYASVVWCPYLKRDIELIEKVQHSATQIWSLDWQNWLMKIDRGTRFRPIPTLAIRRIRGDMIEMFTYMNEIYKVDCSNMLPRHEIGRIYDMSSIFMAVWTRRYLT